MNKLNLDKPFLGLDGKEVGVKLNELLANSLGQSSEREPIKFFDWAVKLYNEGFIEVDNADLELITKFIKDNAQLTTMAKGRLLEAMKKEDDSKAKKAS